MLVTQSREDVVSTITIDDITYQNVKNNPRQIFNQMKMKSDTNNYYIRHSKKKKRLTADSKIKHCSKTPTLPYDTKKNRMIYVRMFAFIMFYYIKKTRR